MKKRYIFYILFCLILISFNAKSQSQEYVSLKGTIVKSIKSEIVKDMEYKLNITLPPQYKSDIKYPVLFYLDAWMTTGIMNDAHFMVTATKIIKPVILVGISFEGTPSDFFYNRSRDYTPTFISSDNLGEQGAMVPVSGGANNFYGFIKEELIPFIENDYSINKNDLGILGYSLGGLFAAWVLKEDPSLFKRYGICSPSLHWDDLIVVRNMEDLNADNKVIFISSTEIENPGIKEGISKIETIFENKGIKFQSEEIKGEKHFTGVPASYMRAMVKLYGNN